MKKDNMGKYAFYVLFVIAVFCIIITLYLGGHYLKLL